MKSPARSFACGLLPSLVLLLLPRATTAAEPREPIAVRQREGALHGFLALSTLEGKTLAAGDLVQTLAGDRVSSRLTFAFKDGSVHEESATFSQQRAFRLLSYHLVQKGPSFPHPVDVTLDARGQVTVRYEDEGETKVASERYPREPAMANGLIPILLRNLSGDLPEIKVPMLAATPKPRKVVLEIRPDGEEAFAVEGFERKATRFVVKVEIGGLTGIVAPLVGKQPPDTYVWISKGEGPAFLKSEGPLYVGVPVWRIELTAPRYPKAGGTQTSDR
jgi:hypothetical protein